MNSSEIDDFLMMELEDRIEMGYDSGTDHSMAKMVMEWREDRNREQKLREKDIDEV